MTSVILDGILPLAERHVRGTLHNARTTLRRLLKMTIDVLNVHENVLRDVVSLRRSIGSTLPAKHDGTFRDRELCVANHAVAFGVKAL